MGGPVPPGIESDPTGDVNGCCYMAAAANQPLSYWAEVYASAGATDPPLQSSESWVPTPKVSKYYFVHSHNIKLVGTGTYLSISVFYIEKLN